MVPKPKVVDLVCAIARDELAIGQCRSSYRELAQAIGCGESYAKKQLAKGMEAKDYRLWLKLPRIREDIKAIEQALDKSETPIVAIQDLGRLAGLEYERVNKCLEHLYRFYEEEIERLERLHGAGKKNLLKTKDRLRKLPITKKEYKRRVLSYIRQELVDFKALRIHYISSISTIRKKFGRSTQPSTRSLKDWLTAEEWEEWQQMPKGGGNTPERNWEVIGFVRQEIAQYSKGEVVFLTPMQYVGEKFGLAHRQHVDQILNHRLIPNELALEKEARTRQKNDII